MRCAALRSHLKERGRQGETAECGPSQVDVQMDKHGGRRARQLRLPERGLARPAQVLASRASGGHLSRRALCEWRGDEPRRSKYRQAARLAQCAKDKGQYQRSFGIYAYE